MTKKNVADIRKMKGSDQRISVLTAYDASFARILEAAGVDMLLVGDSLGNVVMGYDSTVPVTMDEMIHHCRAVRNGAPNTLVVGDMPFLSYQVSFSDAIKNAGRFMKEAGADSIKLEGGLEVCETVQAIKKAGIPVMGHIGLTPQTAGNLGGYTVQGKDLASAKAQLKAAKGLEEAGAFAVVLECVPASLAQLITEQISIATIGIGAGAGCDGQVLVTHDLLGMFEKFTPKFVKQFAYLAPEIKEAVLCFIQEVKNGEFPGTEHSFPMKFDVKQILETE